MTMLLLVEVTLEETCIREVVYPRLSSTSQQLLTQEHFSGTTRLTTSNFEFYNIILTNVCVAALVATVLFAHTVRATHEADIRAIIDIPTHDYLKNWEQSEARKKLFRSLELGTAIAGLHKETALQVSQADLRSAKRRLNVHLPSTSASVGIPAGRGEGRFRGEVDSEQGEV
ncbi:unnamed protein product [Amoebophrya sp. A25]|nr:unnamed protein product [Amoebophrya sp. A25]|eukprot:GSA25T00008789001.1